MHVMIIGAAGMIGRKLAQRIAADGVLNGTAVRKISQYDVVAPEGGDVQVADLCAPSVPALLVAQRPDVIFHLAAIVSGEAEADFDKGYRVNLAAVQALIEAIRAVPEYCPRVVFTSSIAVFGAPFPEKIGDDYHLTPRTSYGTQKAIAELLLDDYSRRGILDAVSLRLPTVCVRPGRPNLAASGFFSNIIREPLAGKEAILPVSDSVRHWFASPASTIGFLIHAAGLSGAALGHHRALSMPGLSCTVAEQIEALRDVVGQDAVDLIRVVPDETVRGIVANWPQDFVTPRAHALGFVAENSFDDIIKRHIVDELGGEAS